MSAEVKILVEGYTNADSIAESGQEKTCATVSLIRDGDLTMVVDPGVLENQQILIDALLREGLGVDDVDVVCITHSHIDHYRNVGMFPNAKVLEFFGLWDKNTVSEWPEHFSPNIQVVATAGHNNTDITLFVTTEEGMVAVCGDVFWKENYPKDPKDDMFASNPEELKKSREMVLRMADWIIPGHGKMFEAKKSYIEKIAPKISNGKKNKKNIQTCRKCHRPMEQGDKCICRPWLCFRCCECDLSCDNCSCSHRRGHKKLKHKILGFLNKNV